MSFASLVAAGVALLALVVPPGLARGAPPPVSPYASWTADAPGVGHRFTSTDMKPLVITSPVANVPAIVPRPAGARPAVPPGFQVHALRTGLVTPRTLRFAPDGDLFVAESHAGRITVLRLAKDGSRVISSTTFASGLDMPSGIAFWPPGPDPSHVYIGSQNKIVRYPYRNGDRVARGPAEPVIPDLPGSGHWTRDLAFTADGRHLFVAVGSLSNDAGTMPEISLARIHAFEATHGRGAAWGEETGRATVLETTPSGHPVAQYANGIRNCAGLAVAPDGKTPWCVVNERDRRGDTAPADYATPIVKGGFYGWPWFYIGNHEDPAHRDERPDLAKQVIMPEVLFPAHSAPLGLAFYTAHQFPAAYAGSIFVAMHGSCCRRRAIIGYKVVRLLMHGGQPTGGYQDFLTGFVIDAHHVWGRPVDVTVAPDGSLLVSDDGSGTVWRISYTGR